MYSLASTLLYGPIIIADSLPLLVRGVNDPPVPGLTPKRELFDRIKHLYLEYSDKRDGLAPSGTFVEGVDSRVAEMEAELRGRLATPWDHEVSIKAVRKSLREAVQLEWAWGEIMEGDRPKPIFMSLETLSIGAIFGQDEEAEEGQRSGSLSQQALWDFYRTAQTALLNFVAHSPSIKHYCVTGTGPLSFGGHNLRRLTCDKDANRRRATRTPIAPPSRLIPHCSMQIPRRCSWGCGAAGIPTHSRQKRGRLAPSCHHGSWTPPTSA